MRAVTVPVFTVSTAIAIAWAIIRFGTPESPERVQTTLTNIATIGGIVSALSLSSTAVLTLTGSYKSEVLDKGAHLPLSIFLFFSFPLVVVASLVCAVSALWAPATWHIWVIAVSVAVIYAVLLFTTFVFWGAYQWEALDKRNDKSTVRLPPPDRTQ
ncbi:hypothetical protein CIP101434_02037 [Corynebacterium diphtheriae]|nr:hypothetical protein BHF83_11630 [Corynebacterium diphtheriae]OWO24047.1 hypothetical protein AY535_08600 [Corynebacterium diphtheriae bv. gravis]OWX96598.1 hypothetical protein B1A53_10900 [Corynebacterium diphtheriae]CAB0507289.1 hypothetical protein CIP103987_01116 [Corynebacterium diphtheriae]CAB0518768.1 hypothetical protein CIP101280_01727 [Corynebacterium diphtheriae]